MAKITEILQKRAVVDLSQALPKAIIDPIRQGNIPPENVPDILEELASTATASAVRRHMVHPQEAQKFQKHLHGYLKRYQTPLQAEAYRSSSSVAAPVSPTELGVTTAMQLGLPMAMSRIPFFNRSSPVPDPHNTTMNPSITHDPKAHHIGPRGALEMWMGPKYFLPTAAISSVASALRPIGDPLYRAGKRSYFKSLHEGVMGEAQNLTRAGEEARKRYGLLGVPLQALHGVMNPIASIYSGGQAVHDLLMGKKGEDMSLRAEVSISRALSKNALT